MGNKRDIRPLSWCLLMMLKQNQQGPLNHWPEKGAQILVGDCKLPPRDGGWAGVGGKQWAAQERAGSVSQKGCHHCLSWCWRWLPYCVCSEIRSLKRVWGGEMLKHPRAWNSHRFPDPIAPDCSGLQLLPVEGTHICPWLAWFLLVRWHLASCQWTSVCPLCCVQCSLRHWDVSVRLAPVSLFRDVGLSTQVWLIWKRFHL